MLNAAVFQAALSPPAPACLSTKLLTLTLAPRSTCSHLVAPSEHHLVVVEPSTAMRAISVVVLQELSAVAGLFSARLPLGAGVLVRVGVAVGTVPDEPRPKTRNSQKPAQLSAGRPVTVMRT